MVTAITDETGTLRDHRAYKPFGEMHAAPTTIEDPVSSQVTALLQEETKGWIGER